MKKWLLILLLILSLIIDILIIKYFNFPFISFTLICCFLLIEEGGSTQLIASILLLILLSLFSFGVSFIFLIISFSLALLLVSIIDYVDKRVYKGGFVKVIKHVIFFLSFSIMYSILSNNLSPTNIIIFTLSGSLVSVVISELMQNSNSKSYGIK